MEAKTDNQTSLAIHVLRQKYKSLCQVDKDLMQALLAKAICESDAEADLAIAAITETVYWSER